MMAAAALSAALDGFAQNIDALAAIAERTDPERRLELTRLRRQLADRIAAMRDGTRAFADPAVAAEFRSRLSAVLSGVAMHQANWPAVSIDDGAAAYRQSAAALAASNRAFIAWTRAALAATR